MYPKFPGLFPETSTIILTYNHFLFLDNLLPHKTLLQKELQKLNLIVEYDIVPGRHCAMDAKNLVNFFK